MVRAAITMACLAFHTHAAAIIVPPGLNPGDTYRILFVTSTTRDAKSANISDYNTFVTNAANLDANLLALGTTWSALASTLTVNALTNAGLSTSDTTTRFYNTAGALLATGVAVPTTGLYGGDTTAHTAAILLENGAVPASSQPIWTGTGRDGLTLYPVGTSSEATAGITNATSYKWMTAFIPPDDFQLSYYGVSAQLQVPENGVPEPGSIALTGLGTAAIFFFRRVRPR